jgi:hypothetical protein
METQYDLNIWDYGTHNGNDPQWRISVHQLEYATDGHVQCGQWIEGTHLDLTDDEVVDLTLGWEPELGGDYSCDSDFFLDSDSFFDIYKSIPQRVADFVHSLPPYTMKDWRK